MDDILIIQTFYTVDNAVALDVSRSRLLPMLNFIASSIWTRLFGHSAELLKGGANDETSQKEIFWGQKGGFFPAKLFKIRSFDISSLAKLGFFDISSPGGPENRDLSSKMRDIPCNVCDFNGTSCGFSKWGWKRTLSSNLGDFINSSGGLTSRGVIFSKKIDFDQRNHGLHQ